MSDINNDSYNTISILLSSAVIFALVSSPYAYKLTSNKLKEHDIIIATEDGCPYALGILLHSIIFLLLFSVVNSKNYVYIITVILLLVFSGVILYS
jgi:hypothetical protein